MFWTIVFVFLAAVFLGWKLPQPAVAWKFQQWIVNALRQLWS
jgi:hypothetical protein